MTEPANTNPTPDAQQTSLLPTVPVTQRERFYFTYFDAKEGSPTTYGPFTSEAKRGAAVRMFLYGEMIDPCDTLYFLYQNPKTMGISSYWMDIEEFETRGSHDLDLDMVEEARNFKAFCEAEENAFLEDNAIYLMAYTGSPDLAGPFATPEQADEEARRWVNGEGNYSPLSDGDMDYLFMIEQSASGQLFVEELSISIYEEGGSDEDEAEDD